MNQDFVQNTIRIIVVGNGWMENAETQIVNFA
jgi:hypothetical protein